MSPASTRHRLRCCRGWRCSATPSAIAGYMQLTRIFSSGFELKPASHHHALADAPLADAPAALAAAAAPLESALVVAAVPTTGRVVPPSSRAAGQHSSVVEVLSVAA